MAGRRRRLLVEVRVTTAGHAQGELEGSRVEEPLEEGGGDDAIDIGEHKDAEVVIEGCQSSLECGGRTCSLPKHPAGKVRGRRTKV